MSCNIVRLCGITSRFQLLSPSTRQVTHALLTRPPLSHKELHTEIICSKCFVRLACVKHAASVHPEPGSNSHKKFFPFQNQLANFNHSLIPNVTVLGCFDFRLCCSLELILIANCFAVLNESFKVISLFSYQSSLFVAVQQLLHLTRCSIACQQLFLFFICCSLRQLNHIIMYPIVCQQLFSCFLIDSGEGGI